MDNATVQKLLAGVPDIDMRSSLALLAKRDPVIWSMVYRRLRGFSLTYNAAKFLTAQSLAELQGSCNNDPEKYLRQVKMRLLRHRPFLIEPLRDEHPHKVYKKGRQTGVSELSVTEAVWFLASRDPSENAKWIYTFPRLEQLQTFSDTRIKEIFGETKRLKELLTGTTAATRKRIGNGFLILRSAWDAGLGEGVDASAVTLDEKDRMKERIDIAFRESLESSPYGWLREVSTPSTPNRHIDASYQLSDQRQWFVRCERCNEAQPIQWTESGRDSSIQQVLTVPIGCTELPEGAYAYLCRKEACRGRLNRMAGEWVAKYPSKTKIRGYHIPQTIAPWQGATELMQKKINYKWLQLWLNYCMGETSVGETVLLHLSDFERISNDYPLVAERPEGFHDIAVGIDWGHQNWVVVFGIGPAWDGTERPYLLNAARFDDVHNIELEGVKRIEQFIRPFDPDIIVADAGFGKDRNSYLLRRFGVGKFYACNYNPASRGSRAFQPVWSNPDTARLLIDRTMSLKDMCAAIREGDFGCPSLEHAIIRQWADHCLALTPHKEFDESPDGAENTAVVEVINKTGDDHLAHATNYALHGLAHLTKRGRFSFDFI